MHRMAKDKHHSSKKRKTPNQKTAFRLAFEEALKKEQLEKDKVNDRNSREK